MFSKPLCDLVNLVFVSGTFPRQLKTAKIIPVYKEGDPLDCTNYHPISLYSRMNKFLENHKCFYKNQFRFRKKHPTNHAVMNGLDNNQYACGVFLDFQKAFDTVNHRILLSKLEYYGIKGIPHDFIN